ncbi:MAG: hypothetical protein MJ054_01970, partial [Clostridia bacterium]|nr:hypothetical protein [Clostridia bacterium]
ILLFSTLVIALVLLFVCGATISPAVQLKTLSVNPAGTTGLKGVVLFDDNGNYAVDQLQAGYTYQFFGYDWRLVLVNGNVATFWMADPYTTTYFNKVDRSASDPYPDGSNIWANGYTKTLWKSSLTKDMEGGQVELSQSDIREFLSSAAVSIIDNSAYAKYKDKVVAGCVVGNNEANSDARKTVEYLKYAKSGLNQVQRIDNELNQLTACYDLNENDRLWLPSKGDLRQWGVLSSSNRVLKPNTLKWTETTISGYAWLRNPSTEESDYANVISYDGKFYNAPISEYNGVRPAIHLDLSNFTGEYKSDRSSWWNDDWLKVLFMVVCGLGVAGLLIVITAVIIKARKAKNA